MTKLLKEKKQKIIIHPQTINAHFAVCCMLYIHS